MVSDFRRRIEIYQIPDNFKRYRVPNGKCPLGYPEKVAEHTRTLGYNFRFARHEEEGNIGSHNSLLLADFWSYHCL
jgi:hypothetical protein